jgi:hypothetical protein
MACVHSGLAIRAYIVDENCLVMSISEQTMNTWQHSSQAGVPDGAVVPGATETGAGSLMPVHVALLATNTLALAPNSQRLAVAGSHVGGHCASLVTCIASVGWLVGWCVLSGGVLRVLP